MFQSRKPQCHVLREVGWMRSNGDCAANFTENDELLLFIKKFEVSTKPMISLKVFVYTFNLFANQINPKEILFFN